jgi:hypothetical protein
MSEAVGDSQRLEGPENPPPSGPSFSPLPGVLVFPEEKGNQ